MTPALLPDPALVRASMRLYTKAHEAHVKALAALVRSSDPDTAVLRYRDVLVTAFALREAVYVTLGTLGLPLPDEDATVEDLQGLVPDIITIQEV